MLSCRNVGPIDRGLRIIIGIVLLLLCVVGPQTWWGLVGLVPLITGAIGTCPLYRLFGKASCNVSERK